METVVVTGGAGFIGSNLAAALLEQGFAVRIVDNLATGNKQNLAPILNKIEFIEGDIADPNVMIEASKECSVILHQAAIPSVPRSIEDPIATNRANVIGTLQVLESARKNKVGRVVYASSSSVYGDAPQEKKSEALPTDPLNPYAVSKLVGEQYCKIYSELYGLETVSLRYFNVFGPHQDPTSQYSAVIPKFITSLLNNKAPTIYGDGEQSRDFTFVQNVVDANIIAATKQEITGSIFNIACSDKITVNELAIKIAKLLGKDIQAEHAEARAGEIKHSTADITKAKKELEYDPKIGFEEGLKQTVEWFRGKNK